MDSVQWRVKDGVPGDGNDSRLKRMIDKMKASDNAPKLSPLKGRELTSFAC